MASHTFPRTAHWPSSLPSSFLLIPQARLPGQVPRQQGFITASRIFNFVASRGKRLKLSVVQGQFFCRSIFFLRNFFFSNIFLPVLGLHCCAQAFCSCSEQGLLSGCSTWASRCGGFSCFGGWVSVVAGSQFSCPVACGIFLDQRSNPYPLHWQAVLIIGSPGKCDQYFCKTF